MGSVAAVRARVLGGRGAHALREVTCIGNEFRVKTTTRNVLPVQWLEEPIGHCAG